MVRSFTTPSSVCNLQSVTVFFFGSAIQFDISSTLTRTHRFVMHLPYFTCIVSCNFDVFPSSMSSIPVCNKSACTILCKLNTTARLFDISLLCNLWFIAFSSVVHFGVFCAQTSSRRLVTHYCLQTSCPLCNSICLFINCLFIMLSICMHHLLQASSCTAQLFNISLVCIL